MRTLYWGRVWAQTDVTRDAWVCATVRPWWYWLVRRMGLFLLLVWRRYEPDCQRFDVALAWEISAVAVGLVGPVPIHGGPRPESVDTCLERSAAK